MDNRRTILWALFAGMTLVVWTKWQQDQRAAQPPEQLASPEAELAPMVDGAEAELLVDDMELPGRIEDPEARAVPAPVAPPQDKLVRVTTDLLTVDISTRGGTLVNAFLTKYPVSKDAPDVPVQLLNNNPGQEYVLASGLVDSNRQGPTHITLLQSSQDSYQLSEDQDVLRVPFRWNSGDGVVVEKAFYFYPARYDIGVEYTIKNSSADIWRSLSYLQIRKDHKPIERSMFNVDSYSFDGPVIYDGEKYEKLDVDDLAEEPVSLSVAGGWIASIQHHFLSAAVPPTEESFNYDSKVSNGKLTLRGTGPTISVAPGETKTVNAEFFVGPKLQEQLDETAPGLALTVDYGILAILAQPLFWLLQQVHDAVGNWGWSIIIVTFMIKLAFYKLTEASGRSMAKMRKLQPRLKALQERYKDDRQALSQHMMDLYKREKVNPAAGCLPMLVQIPFFIAFYWVLLESVEMRQAPFALWITDLSSRDPYFVLPLLMGVAMFVQQKLNPAPPDPVQAKVMMFLPVMFTVFFAFFPSGLVLYWLTNSVLSVLQQWNINRKMGADG